MQGRIHHFHMLTFSFLYVPVPLCEGFFAIFVLVTFDVLYLKSVRLEHFLELNYRGLNLNFLKLVQLLIDDDIESNPGPTQMIVNLHVDVII